MEEKIISNEKIDKKKLELAKQIILNLQNDMQSYTQTGHGPFIAAIYDETGNLITKNANTVINETCSNNHAEINAIKAAQKILRTHDLSKYNLKIYITAEPCMMCLGAIMWSGIKEIYYGVSSKNVEKITGFDEGFKPNWLEEFKKRNITVYGNIEEKTGMKELQNYMNQDKIVYKPAR